MRYERRTWTDEQLIDAIKTSKTKREAILKMGLKIPGSYKIVAKYIKSLNIDTSHFQSGLQVQRRINPALPIEQLLTENSTHDYRYIKSRVIKDKLLPWKCSECGIDSWCGKPLTLQMDHINGINNDHRLENLRFICPNCHSQTETYCGKNQKKKSTVKHLCKHCQKPIYKSSTFCRKCTPHQTKANWPSNSDLTDLVKKENNFEKVGRQFGVTGAAVKKRLRDKGLWPF